MYPRLRLDHSHHQGPRHPSRRQLRKGIYRLYQLSRRSLLRRSTGRAIAASLPKTLWHRVRHLPTGVSLPATGVQRRSGVCEGHVRHRQQRCQVRLQQRLRFAESLPERKMRKRRLHDGLPLRQLPALLEQQLRELRFRGIRLLLLTGFEQSWRQIPTSPSRPDSLASRCWGRESGYTLRCSIASFAGVSCLSSLVASRHRRRKRKRKRRRHRSSQAEKRPRSGKARVRHQRTTAHASLNRISGRARCLRPGRLLVGGSRGTRSFRRRRSPRRLQQARQHGERGVGASRVPSHQRV